MDFAQASILISSSEPLKLAKFYSLLIEANYSKGFSNNDFSIIAEKSLSIRIFKPSSKPLSHRNENPTLSFCFEKPSSTSPSSVIQDWIDYAISLGATLLNGPFLESFGAEAWLSDFEGNRFLLFVPLIHLNSIKP